jgi:hypothetical protein
MKSDKRHQGSRDPPEDHLVDQRGNGSKGGVRPSSRDGRKLRGTDPAEINDSRQSDGELSSEGSEESRSSQEEVSWIQVDAQSFVFDCSYPLNSCRFNILYSIDVFGFAVVLQFAGE